MIMDLHGNAKITQIVQSGADSRMHRMPWKQSRNCAKDYVKNVSQIRKLIL
jgi:hypothetical protein